MLFPVDIFGKQTSLLVVIGGLMMISAVVLLFAAYAAMLHNCGKQGLIDDNADLFSDLSVVIGIISFVVMLVGVIL